VTARERSVLTITEVPGTSTIELGAGRISVAVSKGLMKPGEVVEIRTPNAVTAIRGTVVVAEVFPVASGVQSTITVLRGLVDVTRLDSVTRHRVGPSVDVGTRQAVTAIGSNSLSRPAPIGPDEAQRLTADFQIVPSTAPSAAATAALQQATRQAELDAQALLSAQPAGTVTPSGDLSISGSGVSSTGGSSATASVNVGIGSSTLSVGAHPGFSRTELQYHGPRLGGGGISARALGLLTPLVGQPAARGALPVLRAATDPDVEGGDYYGPGGPGEARGLPRKVNYSKTAYDQQLGGRLWQASEALTGVRFPALSRS